jgi:HAD superfamily hydrolase (TIGR01549 family)
VLFDVDGTLIDSNYLHVGAWWEAFRSQGHDVAMTDLHRLIGRGSEDLVESVLGRRDSQVVEAHTDFYAPRLRQLRAFPDAARLLRRTASCDLGVILATSASDKEAAHLRAALDADDVIDHMSTSEDADAAKPEPDILLSSLQAVGVSAVNCVFVGDSVWDVEACQRIEMLCVALLSGGICAHDLREAGAVAVYRDAAELFSNFDESPLGQLAGQMRGAP